MSYDWQIEQTDYAGMTTVTIHNVPSRHLPLRLGQSEAANSVLIQLLRHTGFAEEEYPYQSYYANHGWGPKHEGIGIVLTRRYRNGEVPGSEVLYQLTADSEATLLAAPRRYTPFAHYFASPASQPDLSVIEARIGRMAEAIAELRGNVGELINTRPAGDEVVELSQDLRSRVAVLESRTETVYDTLYHSATGVLTRISSLEAARHDTLALQRRIRSIEEMLQRLVRAFHGDPAIRANGDAMLGSVEPNGEGAPDQSECSKQPVAEVREDEHGGETHQADECALATPPC